MPRVRLATADDDEELRRFTRSQAMPGRVRLAVVHGFDPAAQTVVAERAGRVVACGRRIVRERFVNGTLAPVAYLSTLRLADPDKRTILHGYGLLRELHEADGRPVTFTSVMSGNASAARMFGKPRRGLPAYEELGNYVTHLLPIRKIEIFAFWVARFRWLQGWPIGWSDAMPADGQFGDGASPATRPIGDWRILGYGGLLRLVRRCLPPVDRPLSSGASRRTGTRDPTGARREAEARGWTHLLFGTPQRCGNHRRWIGSRLFGVRWPGDDWHLDGRPVWPEVADL